MELLVGHESKIDYVFHWRCKAYLKLFFIFYLCFLTTINRSNIIRLCYSTSLLILDGLPSSYQVSLGQNEREMRKYKKLSRIHNFYCCNSDSIFPSTTFISLVLNCRAEQHQDKEKEDLIYQNVFKWRTTFVHSICLITFSTFTLNNIDEPLWRIILVLTNKENI